MSKNKPINDVNFSSPLPEEAKWVYDYNNPPERFRPIWQLCPKCGGRGNVPIHVPHSTTSQPPPKQCDVCFGKMIIPTPR